MKHLSRGKFVVIIAAIFIFWGCTKDNNTSAIELPQAFAQLRALPDTAPIYMFCYFINEGKEGLFFAYSTDGYQFAALNKDHPFITPLVSNEKLMRDPCIVRGVDGLFHLVWTAGWNLKGIGYTSSPDLVHWSEQKYLPVMEDRILARNCWGPEITYDKVAKTYMIYWATTIEGLYPMPSDVESGYNHRIYYTATKDFKIFSPAQLLYDPGFNVIDATIIPANGGYFMFMKDETLIPVNKKNIRTAFSDSLQGPYSAASAPITGNYWTEGPTVTKIGNQWIAYFEKYINSTVGAVSSTDLIHWTDISDIMVFPAGVKHGSVFTITKKEFFSYFL